MSMWQTELSVEQQVAQNMGDEDWDEIYAIPCENIGCYRKATAEVEKSYYLEAEPLGLKYNPLFDQ